MVQIKMLYKFININFVIDTFVTKPKLRTVRPLPGGVQKNSRVQNVTANI
jgi:hypothetical protein